MNDFNTFVASKQNNPAKSKFLMTMLQKNRIEKWNRMRCNQLFSKNILENFQRLKRAFVFVCS